jgi:hypothetical protein
MLAVGSVDIFAHNYRDPFRVVLAAQDGGPLD